MGTSESVQPRTRNSKRDAAIYGFAGTMLVLIFMMTVSGANTWYLVLGTCIIAIGAVMYVAKAIVVLRKDEYATPE